MRQGDDSIFLEGAAAFPYQQGEVEWWFPLLVFFFGGAVSEVGAVVPILLGLVLLPSPGWC